MAAFVNCDVIELETENEFNQKLLRLKFAEYIDSRENSLKIKRDKQLDAVKCMRISGKKRKIQKLSNPTKKEFQMLTNTIK